MSKRAAHGALFIALFALVAWIGYTLHFGMFALYDDEGYVLITLRDYGRHGGLYTQIFTQYGPVFYLFYDGLHQLFGFEWSNTTARWITLINWVGAATACSWLIYRVTGWIVPTLFAFSAVFAYLWLMIREPMHPGSTITLWVSLVAISGVEAIRSERWNLLAGVGGAIGAGLALIKINVGAFLIFSVATWLIVGTAQLRLRPIRIALVLSSFLLPVALMHNLLGETWVQIFALTSSFAISGTILATTVGESRIQLHPAAWWWFLGGGLAVTVFSSVALVLTGSSFESIWNGVIVAPLKHPNVYSLPVQWSAGVVSLSIGTFLFSWWAYSQPTNSLALRTVAWLRIVACLGLLITVMPSWVKHMPVINFCYGLPLVGIFVWPLDHRPKNIFGIQVRAWVGLILVFQSLHAYPVAGTQIAWSSFLWVPLAILGFHEAVNFIAIAQPRFIYIAKIVSGALVSVLAVNLLWFFGSQAFRQREYRERLEVRGAEQVRLPEQVASGLRVITENAHAHADMLFSLPGIYSLNLWSDVPTPTLANATHWFSLLNESQQLAWIDSLERAKRPVFVVQHNILALLIETGFRPQSPVLDYVRSNYRRSFAVEGYSFWVRNDRMIAPLSTGLLTTRTDSDPSEVRLDLTVNARPGAVVAIELWNVVNAQWHALTLTAENSRVDLTPLKMDGTEAAATRPISWPFNIDALSRIGVEFAAPPALPPGGNLEAVLIGAGGKRIGIVRLLPKNGFALPPFTPPDAGPPTTN